MPNRSGGSSPVPPDRLSARASCGIRDGFPAVGVSRVSGCDVEGDGGRGGGLPALTGGHRDGMSARRPRAGRGTTGEAPGPGRRDANIVGDDRAAFSGSDDGARQNGGTNGTREVGRETGAPSTPRPPAWLSPGPASPGCAKRSRNAQAPGIHDGGSRRLSPDGACGPFRCRGRDVPTRLGLRPRRQVHGFRSRHLAHRPLATAQVEGVRQRGGPARLLVATPGARPRSGTACHPFGGCGNHHERAGQGRGNAGRLMGRTLRPRLRPGPAPGAQCPRSGPRCGGTTARP